MEKLTLNFFGEKAEIPIPKSLDNLRQQISDKFAFSPSETADLLISYTKDLGQKIIDAEKDFREFISNKIPTIDLDIKEDSKLFVENLNTLKAQANSDHTQLENLLKKKQSLNVEKKKIVANEKKQVENVKKEYKEIINKKKELIKMMQKEIKQLKRQQTLKIKEIKQSRKKLLKEEKETNSKIIELQKKLGYPVTIGQKKPQKKIVLKKIKKEIPKKQEKKPLFEGVNNVINKMLDKVNNIVNNQVEKEKKNVEKKEKEIHESKIELKPEEQKGIFDLKKISNDAITELNKWTQFVMNHTNELTENLNKKYQECKNMLEPVEIKLKGVKKIFNEKKNEEIIHHCYICDGCEMRPIKGIRYHCKNCPDFDFCENCYANKKNEHKHVFEAIKKPIDPMEQNKNEIRILEKQRVHIGVTCDGCGQYPIIGNRYKCAVCKNFDFCEKCEEKHAAKDHLHPFIKIYTPEIKLASIKCVVNEDCPDYESKK